MSSGANPPIYLLDTSCFLSLDGIERANLYGDAERQRIWKGIHDLGARVTIITQVKKELKRHYPPPGPLPARITSLPNKATGFNMVPLTKKVRYIIDNYPSLVNVNATHTLDPADPWVIAAAQEHGYVVVTDELKKSVRKYDKLRDHIPDVCDALGIPCITFREFIVAENLSKQ